MVSKRKLKAFTRMLPHTEINDPWTKLFGKSKSFIGNEALDFIFKHIPHGSTVLELGGGQSTSKLVKHYKVYCVEDNKKYLNIEPEAHYIYAPLTEYYDKGLNKKDQWYDRTVLEHELPTHYNIIIVDGPQSKLGRYGIARYYDLFLKDVPILIDDLQIPYIYSTALLIAREKKAKHIHVNITNEGRVFGWIP